MNSFFVLDFCRAQGDTVCEGRARRAHAQQKFAVGCFDLVCVSVLSYLLPGLLRSGLLLLLLLLVVVVVVLFFQSLFTRRSLAVPNAPFKNASCRSSKPETTAVTSVTTDDTLHSLSLIIPDYTLLYVPSLLQVISNTNDLRFRTSDQVLWKVRDCVCACALCVCVWCVCACVFVS